ncbi:MAG: hypothetical protein ACTSU2_07495 [Promethearchaeota archaeon]
MTNSNDKNNENEDEEIIFFNIKQIDAMKGMITPHENDIRKTWEPLIEKFRDFKEEDLNRICKELDMSLIDMDQGEEWALKKEVFKDIYIYILYQYYGDEFGDEEEDEFQVVFGGDKVLMVSGEDLTELVQVVFDYIDAITGNNKSKTHSYSAKPSIMLEKALNERIQGFLGFPQEEFANIIKFVGEEKAKVINNKSPEETKEGLFGMEYSLFPELIIRFYIEENKEKGAEGDQNNQNNNSYKYHGKFELKYDVKGKAIELLTDNDIELAVIMTINQALRYIKLKYDEWQKEPPKICNLMFSGYYMNKFPEKFNK